MQGAQVRTPAAAVALFLALTVAAPVFSDELSADELRERLALLDSELTAERAALDSMRQAHKTELEEARTDRRARASELLKLENSRQERVDEERGLLDRLAKLDSHGTDAADRVRDVGARLRALAERLDLQLSEVPGTDALRAVLPDIEARLNDPDRMATAFESLLRLADATHARASEIGVSSAEIRTATGELEGVELLSAGHMSFAYRIGDRLGLALSSPADASGFRWSEPAVSVGPKSSTRRAGLRFAPRSTRSPEEAERSSCRSMSAARCGSRPRRRNAASGVCSRPADR